MKMKIKLIIAWIGNLIDAFATVYLLSNYSCFYEINPFMAWLLQFPILAIVCKLVVISVILAYLYYAERDKCTEAVAGFAAIWYGGIGAYYLILLGITKLL